MVFKDAPSHNASLQLQTQCGGRLTALPPGLHIVVNCDRLMHDVLNH